VFWNYLCLNDFPHSWDIGNFKFHNSEHNVNQSRSKQLCFSTRYNVLNSHPESYHFRNCTCLRCWSKLPIAPSAAEMPPLHLNPLFIMLRIALEEEDSRWGDIWFLEGQQESAMAITKKLGCCNQLHATCRTNQLPECSCLQQIRICHILTCTHNLLGVCYLLLCSGFKPYVYFQAFCLHKI
jgi:hypothetical protein